MNLQEIYDAVEHAMMQCQQRNQDPSEIRVCIPIQTVNAVGGTPCADIKSVYKGFDWDNNKLMLYPEKDLSLTNNVSLTNMRKEAKEMGWTAYEVGSLKREIKSLRKQLGDNP